MVRFSFALLRMHASPRRIRGHLAQNVGVWLGKKGAKNNERSLVLSLTMKESFAPTPVKEPKKKNEDRSRLLAAAAIEAALPSAQVIAQITKLGKEECLEVARQISKRSGDTAYLEEVLLAQAVALNVFCSNCLIKAGTFIQSGQAVHASELTTALAKLGLKAQDQSRKTILALNEIRNPKKPTQFIKNYVNQQLNQLQVEQEELKQQLEAGKNAPVDIGSESEASRAYQEVEALGE